MNLTSIVTAFLAAVGLMLSAYKAHAEFLPGTPCPDGYTCVSAEPRDGVCKHPDVVLDDKLKATRINSHPKANAPAFCKQSDPSCAIGLVFN